MKLDGFDVEPLTPSRWEDLEAVLGRGGTGGCWCTYWVHPTSNAWGEGTVGGSRSTNKALFQRMVAKGPAPGLLLYEGESAIAWCRVMPRLRHPGLANSRYFKTKLDVAGVWSLSCFVVRPKHRGRGLTTVLTKAAASYARENGADVLEAYPWDTDEPKYPSTIYTGVASTYSRLGFEVVQRLAPHKPMMRLALKQ